MAMWTLLFVDGRERHEVDVAEGEETNALVSLYTLLSGAQRNANELRQDVADVLLDGVVILGYPELLADSNDQSRRIRDALRNNSSRSPATG